jgi:hypothetical protein
MREWPVVWLIISSSDGSMAAYIAKQCSVEELEIQLT